MAKTFLLGVDIGTTGTKAGLFDEEGRLLATGYEESKLYHPQPGWVEQDPDEIYASALRTIQECLEKSQVDPGRVAALTFDGQMAGIGTIDPEWGTPTPYDSWLDTRCGPYVHRLQEHADLIVQLTGGPPSISHGAKILWWKHERPEVYRRIAKFVVPGAYVAGRMAGLKAEEAFVDRTYLHFSCLSDTQAGRWSQELLGRLGIEATKLPRIVEPWEIVGGVTVEAAQATGLKVGTPIAAGCGDQAAGMLGAGMVDPGQIFDVAGTASVFAVCTDRFVPDRAYRTLFTAHLVIPGLYYQLAYINGGGLNLRWFRDEIATEERKAAMAAGTNFYAQFDALAEPLPPGSGGLLFVPHFGGRVCPGEPCFRGVWLGLSWAHGKAHLYRAMLEGVAYEYAFYQEVVRELAPELRFTETRVIGGGARSRLWNQIKADTLNVPYVRLNREEFAILGSAILAGYAVGVFPDLAETARSMVAVVEQIQPDPTRHAVYRELAAQYCHLLDAVKPILVATSFLSAPTEATETDAAQQEE